MHQVQTNTNTPTVTFDFTIGDEVFIILNNKIAKTTIESATVEYNEDGISILYRLNGVSRGVRSVYFSQAAAERAYLDLHSVSL